MSGGSPQLKSPLISATDSQQASDSTDRSGTPDGITVIPNRATAELRKEQQQLMRKTPTWKLKYQDFIPLISRRIHYHGSEDNSQSFQWVHCYISSPSNQSVVSATQMSGITKLWLLGLDITHSRPVFHSQDTCCCPVCVARSKT